MKKKTNKIPKFKSKDEEAKFWDTHSFADYWDEFKPVDIIVKLVKHRRTG
jgi:CopG antitoxin of type II toxin-antitoxin system